VFKYTIATTSIGELGLLSSARGLKALLLPRPDMLLSLRRAAGDADMCLDDAAFVDLRARLRQFVDGQRQDLDGVVLDMNGTAFQLEVWRLTRAIPWGCTRTYGSIARELGRPGAARAVGAAEGANPVALIIPCHRVVGSNGGLCGFGGGLPLKARLLKQEGGATQLRLIVPPTAPR
jgi:methylated-DNA-[protein]-cysteine S-methyltransferase